MTDPAAALPAFPAAPSAPVSNAAAAVPASANAAVHCPAKLNLGLEVLQRLPDNFHEVCTVLQAIDLYDLLTVSVVAGDGSETPGITISGPFAHEVPEDGNSLLTAWAAAGAANLLPRLAVSLEKNIPAGAGLGGGSSDGAGMLLALREIARQLVFGLCEPATGSPPLNLDGLGQLAGMPEPELHAAALRLGSDTPFFLSAGCQLATGRGELLAPLDRALRFAAVVAVPAFSSLTAGAYAQLQRGSGSGSALCVHQVARGLGAGDWLPLASSLVNDFAPRLYAEHPEYRGWEETLSSCGARAVSISGSGSTMYALFDEPAAARQAGDALLAVSGAGDFRYVGVHVPV